MELTRNQATVLKNYLTVGGWQEWQHEAIVAKFARQMQDKLPMPLLHKDSLGSVQLTVQPGLFSLVILAGRMSLNHSEAIIEGKDC